ncbi:MAG: hypothetical protein HeimC3_33990 [Candidatus Heimdallarchaeota archaeon LC_3]|nr:MAG: hypothetical protein HeimC3_33990 [Candidatus Heimdallarchaeota archaeon LC_3]
MNKEIFTVTLKEDVTAACGCTKCINNKEEKVYIKDKGKILFLCNKFCAEEFYEDKANFYEKHLLINTDQLITVEDLEQKLKNQ